MQALTQLVQDLVAIDSVNPALIPGAAGEGAIAAYVVDWLKQKSIPFETQEAAPGRPNVVATVKGRGGGSRLMLNAHMDTVGVAGMAHPFVPTVVDNRIYGRGALDMKSGLAVAMWALSQARTMDLKGDVVLAAVADEEHASLGTQALVKTTTADAAIVLEPSNLSVCVAHKGFVWLEAQTQGVAMHGSLPDQGVDAIAMMGRLLVAIESLDQRLRSQPAHPYLKSGSIHASLIEGGQEMSSYPAKCTMGIERRTIPGETVQLVEKQLHEMVAKLHHADSNFRASVRATLARDAFEVSQDEAIVQTVLDQSEYVIGKRPDTVGLNFWMDSALLASAGIPTVVFGPAGHGPHAIDEWVSVESVHQCALVLERVIASFCNQPQARASCT